MKNMKITEEDKIFSTGVHLKPIECIINGEKQWRWVAVGFEDETFFEGEIIDVYDFADSFEGLFVVENEKNN